MSTRRFGPGFDGDSPNYDADPPVGSGTILVPGEPIDRLAMLMRMLAGILNGMGQNADDAIFAPLRATALQMQLEIERLQKQRKQG